jgi:uncharacterized membrane protein
MPLAFDHPALLWLLLLAVPIGYLGWSHLRALEGPRRWLAVGLRVAVLLLLVLMLAGLRSERRHEDLTVIAVVDRSASVQVFGESPSSTASGDGVAAATVPLSLAGMLERFIEQAAEPQRQADDRLGVVTYDARPTVQMRPGSQVKIDLAGQVEPREGTDTATALEWAVAAKSDADTALRLLLISDGNDTAGNTLAAARAAAAAGVVIDVLPIRYAVGPEVMVEGVYAPTDAREGQTVAVRVVLRATAASPGQLQLRHDGDLLDLNGNQLGTGQPVRATDWTRVNPDEETNPGTAGEFLLATQIDVPIARTGPNRFEAFFEPLDAGRSDGQLVNNRAEGFTLVQGKGRVLIVDREEGVSGAVLPDALTRRGIELEVVTPAGLPSDMAELTRYDAVVFQNVPAEAVTGRQQAMLARYVNDLGGGFAMLGGPESFGAGGWTNTVIDRDILPVDCEIPAQTVMPSGALAIVIDRSGSMGSPVAAAGGRTQQELANEAASLAIETLYEQDLVGVIAFDSSAQWIVPMQRARDRGPIIDRTMSIQSSGGTEIYAGLELAYQGLTADSQLISDSSIKHVILLSDGGSEGNYEPLLNQMRRANITVSTVGVGDGHDAAKLEMLAILGDGEYHPIDDPNDLPQVFIKEARTIRRNLIKEQTFEPIRQRTGSPIVVGLDATPPLQGLVLTGPKYDRRIEMPMLGPDGEPLFAHWQVGLGKAAAWTSDATNRWAVDWLNWPGYGDFWSRTMRYIARPATNRDAELTTSLDGDTLRIRLDAPPPDGAAAGGNASVRGKLITPSGGGEDAVVDLDLKQTGPGIFEATVPARQTGSYLVNVFVTPEPGQGGEASFVAGGLSKPPGPELRRFQPDLQLLQEVAATTGGRVLDPADPQAAALFDRSHRFETVSSRPLRWTLMPWLIALLLLDIANRRIAWDGPAILAWSKTHLTLHRRSDREQRQTLANLKTRRQQTVAAHGQPDPPATPPRPEQTFQAESAKKPTGNLSDALGGASVNPTQAAAYQATNSNEDDPSGGGTTSRLLDAKRRAREKQG